MHACGMIFIQPPFLGGILIEAVSRNQTQNTPNFPNLFSGAELVITVARFDGVEQFFWMQ